MSDKTNDATGTAPDIPHDQQVEEYGGDRLQARHGRVNIWLCIVYLIMFTWALYYAITYWGGLGPGLDLGLQSTAK
jgi:hypothetical protein